MPDSYPTPSPIASLHTEAGRAIPPQLVLGPVLADLTGSERTRLAPALTRSLAHWTTLLRSARIESAEGLVLALWLPVEVEVEVDQAQTCGPALGLLLHRLASRLLMAAIAQLKPELAAHGCAPLPAMTPELVQALAALGLATAQGLPIRRYALFTPDSHAVPATGCAACSLRAGCPGPKTDELP